MAAEQDEKQERTEGGLKGAYENLRTFLQESWHEVRHKVTWPSKKEVTGTTKVVLVATLIFATYLFALDWIMVNALDRIWGNVQ